MTIDEAIKHAEEVANDMELCCEECAEEHRQLAEWLKELKQYKEQTDRDLISRQTVLDNLSELNIVSFYEAQKDSKETYYEIRQMIKNLPSIIPQ